MKKVIIVDLKKLHKNVTAISISGEIAGFIVTPQKEGEKSFIISHRGKSLGYQQCRVSSFEFIARHYERIPAEVEITMLSREGFVYIKASDLADILMR